MYAQGEQKATLPQDRPLAPGSGSGEVRRAQQPEIASFETKLRIRDGAGRAGWLLNSAVLLHVDLERLCDFRLIPSGGDDGDVVMPRVQAYVAVEIGVVGEPVALFCALRAVDPDLDVAHGRRAGCADRKGDRSRNGGGDGRADVDARSCGRIARGKAPGGGVVELGVPVAAARGVPALLDEDVRLRVPIGIQDDQRLIDEVRGVGQKIVW